MGTVFDRKAFRCEQSVTKTLFTSSAEKPRSVSLATRMQVAAVIIKTSCITDWTAVALGTKFKVNLITHGISPKVMPCSKRRGAIPARRACEAFDVVLKHKAFSAPSDDAVSSYGTSLSD